MKEIKITRNQTTFVDDDDYEMLMNFSWQARPNVYGKYYVVACVPKEVGGGIVTMSRLIMCPDEWMEVDHIDGNTLNNQKSNLRIVTHRENGKNRVDKTKTTSKYIGVDFNKKCQKWRANIRILGKKHFLGHFDTEIEAHNAYQRKSTELEILERQRFINL